MLCKLLRTKRGTSDSDRRFNGCTPVLNVAGLISRLQTVPIYVVGEAEAGSEADWPGPEKLRPITRVGWLQSRGVATCMATLSIGQIVSSPYLRCRQTVQPLADTLGLALLTSSALALGARIESAREFLSALEPVGVVACTHVDMIERLAVDMARRGFIVDEQSNAYGLWAYTITSPRLAGQACCDVIRAVVDDAQA